jgi:hypothetical protein
VKHRTRLIVKIAASGVIIASVVLARLLSEDGVARFAAGQAALFFAFAIATLTLFVFVVFDFDKWVETVPPVPKRAVRRVAGRGTRRIRRAIGFVLALYGILMTRVWTRVGAAFGWLVGRSVTGLAWFWSWTAWGAGVLLSRCVAVMQLVWSATGDAFASRLGFVGKRLELLWAAVVRGGLRALVLYRARMQWLWSRVGHALVWALARTGEGLTLFWAAAVRQGLRGLVLYGAVMQRVWSVTGHTSASTLAHAGRGLTALWAGVVHAGLRALVLYRTGMHWLWSTAGQLVARVGAALSVLGSAIAGAGAWSLGRGGRGIKRLWWAAVGRGDEPTPKPIRRWYTATVDAAFGIPPDDASVDVFGGRAASHRPTATDPERAAGRGEKVGAAGQSDAQQRRR